MVYKRNNERERNAAFQLLELRLLKATVSMIEMLFPPADAPVEVATAAQERQEALTPKQLVALVTEGRRILTEIGRHRRLLTGRPTAIFARADSPDVWIPEDIEQAQEIERRARRAQKALMAAAEGSPIDIEGVVLSPDSADSPDTVGISPDSPTSLNAPDTGVCPERETKEEPGVGL